MPTANPSAPRARRTSLLWLLSGVLIGCICQAQGIIESPAATDWPLHGRTADEKRFSPLTQINRDNVEKVGLAWQTSLDSTRGLEATPIVIGKTMYVTSTWSNLFALDAQTGAIKWHYDPKVPRAWARRGCCDVVSRGVAVSGGRVFLATYDGRLVALDAGTGKKLWEVDSIVDRTRNYTISGAPRVVKDKVIIGNGGADFMVRGYISAFNVRSGKLQWRFYTVPGSASGPFEHPELIAAAKTWDPQSRWDLGGGGTAWDSMSYDPQLDLLYVGTGNGAPWPRSQRSPSGGDNLYLSSILALKPDTGRLAWHYQTTPGDSWDYTATQHMVLADIQWQGKPRKVLFQAPKNGFFYVIDRATGELLAADKYVRVTWANYVDLKTGRPVETDIADYSSSGRVVFPSSLGGHNWYPMSYSEQTGLLYIPAQDAASHFSAQRTAALLGAYYDGFEQIVPDRTLGRAMLLAWDPLERKIVWSHDYPALANAGVLSTAGGLVVQGDGQGFINFFDAQDGRQLKQIPTGTGMIAPPISYSIDGVQYIAIAAGWGGALFGHAEAPVAARKYRNDGRLIALKLGGTQVPMAPPLDGPRPSPMPTGQQVRLLTEAQNKGHTLYVNYCGVCHGWWGYSGLTPDLRRSPPALIDNLEVIVLKGALERNGMPAFADLLTEQDVEALKEYLRAVRIP